MSAHRLLRVGFAPSIPTDQVQQKAVSRAMLKVMIDDVDDSEENGDGSRLKKLQQKLIAKRKDVGIEAGVKELLDGGTYVVLVPNDNR